MEPRNRSAWVIVAVVLVVMCFCTALVAAGAAVSGGIVRTVRSELPVSLPDQGANQRKRTVQTFDVGRQAQLEIDNFAGQVNVRAGGSGSIQVVATKKAMHNRDLDRIQVEMYQRGDRVVIKTRKMASVNNVSVELEITAPATTRLDLRTGASATEVQGFQNEVKVFTGAGAVKIIDVTGDISGYTGAGSVEVRRASGRVQLNTGAGPVSYQGAPQGACRFTTGAGPIWLELPSELNMRVDLTSGMGSVEVEHAVAGSTTRRTARGTIGNGQEGSIYAFTGIGSIDLDSR